MNRKIEQKKAQPALTKKQKKEQKKRLQPAKHLEGNVAKLIERGRLMGF